MRAKVHQFFIKKNLFLPIIFLLILITMVVLFFSFEFPTQVTESSSMKYLCNLAVSYSYNFDTLEWEEDYCSYVDPNTWNPPSEYDYPVHCSHRWCFVHPMGGAGSLVCAFQKCKKVNGDYECQGGFTLDELVKNAEVGDTNGWLVRDCPTEEDLADEAACIRFGGLPWNGYCVQLEAVRAWDIDNQNDCETAGGFWITDIDSIFACMVPQDLLIKIDPGNPDADCSIAGEEACLTLRWLKRPTGSSMRITTLNISPKN